MQLVSRLGRAFWIGLLLIGLSVAVWFVAPQAQSCVTDFASRECDTTGTVVLNVIGLVLFAAGAVSLMLAGAIARNRTRMQRRTDGDDTR